MGHEHTLMMLEAAVSLRIAELRARGGPDEDDLRACHEFVERLGSQGDVLLYGGRRGAAAWLFNMLATALAVLAFTPGGVRFGGRHWVETVDERTES